MKDEKGKPLYISIQHRYEKLKELINKGFKCYEYSWNVTKLSEEIKKEYNNLNPGENSGKHESVAGKILSIRIHGGIIFIDILDKLGKIQVVVKKDVIGDQLFEIVKKYFERGDIIGAKGEVFRTKKGEISVLAQEIKLLAKALRELPDQWYGIEDPDIRFRQRYVDFVINEKARRTVFVRAKLLKYLREFLDSHGFIEVETPILQPIYGGALARPFETYYWALDKKMYLRIAPELYLKRLLVAMFDKVYEVAKCFRNEDIDRTHNPEFTQVEFYAAYWDYQVMMEFTEKLIKYVVENVNGSLEVQYQGKTIDFSNIEKWCVPKKLKEEIGIDVNEYDFEGLKDAVKDLKLEGIEEVNNWGELVELLRETYLEPLTKEKVVFMYLYPKEVTPLAKSYRNDSKWAERFEGFVDGLEFINAYSELNNPIEQFIRFEEQEKLRQKAVELGKLSEAHPMDRDYVRALEYGMPPAAGCGIGIDRLVMILADVSSLREALTFPMLRGEEKIETVCDIIPEAKELFKEMERNKK